MITVAEISECFPNKNKPVTGEFILRHSEALSKFCKVNVIVPLRIIPPKEIFSVNLFKTFRIFINWINDLIQTKSYSEGNLSVIYFRYFSFPRPFFESSENRFLAFFFYKRLMKIIDNIKPDIIYCNWLRPWADLCSRYSSENKIPFVLDHHEDIPTLKKLFPSEHKKILNIFEKADKVIVHSTLNKDELLKENLNLNEVKLIYLGQNFPVIDKEKSFNLDKLKLICVSHLNEPRKNIDILIKAFGIIKDKVLAELIIAGDGVLKEKYISLTDKLSLNKFIKFTGSKSQKELSELYNDADIFILPSFPEAFGIVLTEALARGLPVITCKGSGGGEELKLLGYPSVLIDPLSESSLADAVLKLFNDKSQMSLMSNSGKTLAKNYFSWKMNAGNTFNFLNQTLSEYGK